MEKLIFLGTGHAMTIDCFNTCFILQNNDKKGILVDTGGGSQILKQLRDANINFNNIHNIIISHRHTDHLLGLFWLIRYAKQLIDKDMYDGSLNIYMHEELCEIVKKITNLLLPQKFLDLLDKKIFFRAVKDKQEINILNYNIKFLDILGKKDKQFGFKTKLENGKCLAFLGDETFNMDLSDEIKGIDWLLHEAMCLENEVEIYKPYPKSHSTPKKAAGIAKSLHAKNLIIYHCNDNNLQNRKKLYTDEAKKYFDGNVFVPNDLEIIEL